MLPTHGETLHMLRLTFSTNKSFVRVGSANFIDQRECMQVGMATVLVGTGHNVLGALCSRP